MPRSNRRLYRTSTKKKAPEPKTPPAASLMPTTPSPPPTSFGAALAHGVASGVGWGVGTSAIKAALGVGGEYRESCPSSASNAGETINPSSTLPADTCGRLWVAYERCQYESGGRACDHIKEGLDVVCPEFKAPFDKVVGEATTPTYALSVPPI